MRIHPIITIYYPKIFSVAFSNPALTVEPCPPFSLSITTTELGYIFSYRLRISTEPSLLPSFTVITSISSKTSSIKIESKHLFTYFYVLYTGITKVKTFITTSITQSDYYNKLHKPLLHHQSS